eukprot:Transcript_7782.p3 GENE.Transcript_7782~~Transcript_7782.p3  ORF type:complete len:324 (-),score=46.09 Transcript_7782:114-1085(-)
MSQGAPTTPRACVVCAYLLLAPALAVAIARKPRRVCRAASSGSTTRASQRTAKSGKIASSPPPVRVLPTPGRWNMDWGPRSLIVVSILAGGDGICSELELGDAGLALGAVLGRSAMLMWGLGLFVAGQASVLATTYAGQAIMDGCLRIQLPATTRVLISRLISIGPAVGVAVWTEMSVEMAEKAQLMQWINAFQALQLPFAMLPTLHFAADRGTLGSFRAAGLWLALCWGVALTLILANVLLVTTFVIEWGGMWGPVVVGLALLYAALYFSAIFTLSRHELAAVGGAIRSVAIGVTERITGPGGPPPQQQPAAALPPAADKVV